MGVDVGCVEYSSVVVHSHYCNVGYDRQYSVITESNHKLIGHQCSMRYQGPYQWLGGLRDVIA